jgi:hypothetical protein
LKYEEKTHIWAAGTLLERTSTTGRDHAPFILLAATACPVFFSPHHFRLPRLMYVMATARSFYISENSQPVNRQRRATAKYLEEELGRKSEYSRSQSRRDGGYETQGMSEQGVPLMTSNEIKQMRDFDIIVFHHNLPPFKARRMNWLEHPILRQRQAKQPPTLSPLPPLTPIELRSPLTSVDEGDSLTNPGDFE